MSSRKRQEPADGPSSRRSSQKKTRFVSPEDDPARFAEDVDAALEDHPSTTKRGRVKTDGYDSDSSDDGEGVVLSRRKEAAEGGDDEDDDMFATEGNEDKQADAGESKKKDDFLRLGDIEGQEFGNDKDASSGSESSEDEPEDEDEAERRAKEGMGYEMSSFNMRDEMEEGKFKEDGTYLRSFDKHAVHDKWMEGTSERDMKKARRAQRHQRRLEKERLKEESDQGRAENKEAMEIEMLSLMKKGETVLEALARHGARAKKSKEKEKSAKRSSKKVQVEIMELDGHIKHLTDNTKSSSQPISKIDRLTALSSTFMGLGDAEIYEKTYEHLLRSVRSKGNVNPDWTPPVTKYEYKWDIPEAQISSGDQTFGPFSSEELQVWYEAKYFGERGEKVKVRAVGGEWGDWDQIVDD